MFERKLGKIGLNKGVLVGMLFIVLVLAILIGVKMVRGAEAAPVAYRDLETNKISASPPEWTEWGYETLNNVEINGGSWESLDGKTFTNGDVEVKGTKVELNKDNAKADGIEVKTRPEVKTEIDGNAQTIKTTNADGKVNDVAKAQGQYEIGSDGKIHQIKGSAKVGAGDNNPLVNGDCTKCGNTPSAGGGKGDGGAGGEGSGGKLDKDLEAAMKAVGYVTQLGLKADNFKVQANAPVLKVADDTSGNVNLKEGESAVLVSEDGSKTVVVTGQKGGSIYSWNGMGLGMLTARNGNMIAFANGLAVGGPITTPAGTNSLVEINGEGINTVTPNTQSTKTGTGTPTTGKFILPLVSAASGATAENRANDLGDQYISFVGDDTRIGGLDIGVNMLKSFDNVNAKGSGLRIVDGEVLIDFKNMKTNYPRLVKENEFFINEIVNEYDTKNLFMLVPGGTKGNYFIDGRKRLTVGDAVVKNPLEGYENVMIPKAREAMWKKAADGSWFD